MPGLEKIHLEDALDDSPQTRSMVHLFEDDAVLLRKYVEELRSCCEKVLFAQQDLADATSSLSQHLRLYEKQTFPLEVDSNSILLTTLQDLATILDEVSSLQQVCVSQISDGMLYPLNRFIDADLTDIFTMMQLFATSSNEMEQSVGKFCKISKKGKDGDKIRHEANEEIYTTTKKFHQTALHYYANLNALQYKRKVALLEPMVGYLHALRSVFSVGHETLNTKEQETFLSNITSSVRGVQAEMGLETQKTVELIDSIEQQSAHLYYAECPPEMPYIPPNTNLSQKSGYLFLKVKYAGMMKKWERSYFYTLSNQFMCMNKNELAGSCIMEINKNMTVQVLENDDRSHVFQISSGKKSIVLQALNQRERDEWIATLYNIATESCGSSRRHSVTKHPSNNGTEKSNASDKASPDSSAVSYSSGDNGHASKANNSPTPSSSSTLDSLLLDTPIQFDFTPTENRERTQSMDPQVSADALDELSLKDGTSKTDMSKYYKIFEVRFLGSMQVQRDRGDDLVYQTIRHIMAARAIHNIFKMHEAHMVITHHTLRILDPAHNALKTYFPLAHISFWTTHKENNRLLGFITRSQPDQGNVVTFHCHVFEAQSSADEICCALATAANIALKALLSSKHDGLGDGFKETNSSAVPNEDSACIKPDDNSNLAENENHDSSKSSVTQSADK